MASGYVQVGSVQYAANALNKEVKLSELDPENEIRSFRVQLEMTLISTAAAFAIAAADHWTLVNSALARVKGDWNFEPSALNASPDLLRIWGQDTQGADSWIEDLRVGDQVPISSGAAVAKKIPVDIQFVHQADDAPNMLCMTTDQLNASSAKMFLDFGALATAGGNVVLANGTATVVITDVKILAEYGDAYGIRVGPHWTFRRYGEGKDSDVDTTAGIEHFLAQLSAPATFEAVFAQMQMSIDGRTRLRGPTPTSLALDYLRSSVKRDALRGYDITRNALGGVGPVTPIRWHKAHIRSAEYELPFTNSERRLTFTRAPNAAAVYDFLQVKSHGHSKIADVVTRVAKAYGVAGNAETLKPFGMGGSENDTLKQFKGVEIVRRAGTSAVLGM